MKNLTKSTPFLALLGTMFGVLAMGAVFVTLSSVSAAPAVAPPNGNPVFPAVGPQGPAGTNGTNGSNGATGPQGPPGTPAPLSCTNAGSSCSHGPYSGCAVQVQCPSGYTVTGGGYISTPTGGNVIVFKSYMYSNGWYAYTHDSVFPGGSTLNVYARCCRN